MFYSVIASVYLCVRVCVRPLARAALCACLITRENDITRKVYPQVSFTKNYLYHAASICYLKVVSTSTDLIQEKALI